MASQFGHCTGVPSGLALAFVDFDLTSSVCVPNSAWASARLAELALYPDSVVELSNKSQQKLVPDLTAPLAFMCMIDMSGL